MKKKLVFIVLLSVLLGSCSSNGSSTSKETTQDITTSYTKEELRQQKYKTRTPNSFLPDTHFKNGFKVYCIEHTPEVYCGKLDYGGKAETDCYLPKSDYTNYWIMAQWGGVDNIIDSKFSENGNVYRYENDTRACEIDTDKGSVSLEVDTYKEYQKKFKGKRPNDQMWSHFLFECHWPEELCANLVDLDDVYVKFDITFDELSKLGEEPAQFFFYFCFMDAFTNERLFWFGVPVLDTRYDYITEYKQLDNLHEDNSGLPIFSISSKSYMGDKKPEAGKKYSIDLDVLPMIQNAFIYWFQQGAFKEGVDYSHLRMSYMNIGWEIPGQYKIKSTIENLDIYTTGNF